MCGPPIAMKTCQGNAMSTEKRTVQLGLIGDNIARSRSPRLHEVAGDLIGLAVRYDRLIPKDLDQGFEAVFETAKEGGYRGLNITYPYKERVVPLVTIPDPRVARLGAVNTVVFGPDGPTGHNTDWSGFMAAYRRARGETAPGHVAIVGAGGVGKAIAFGLAELGAVQLRLVERDLGKAEALAEQLRASATDTAISVTGDIAEGCAGADGIVNCTPVGMVGHDGTPVPRELLKGAAWAFDAVYTPPDTQFLTDAAAQGLAVISGEELFFYQGLHAFSFFHRRDIDEARLRDAMISEAV